MQFHKRFWPGLITKNVSPLFDQQLFVFYKNPIIPLVKLFIKHNIRGFY